MAERIRLSPSAASTWMECLAQPGFVAANSDKIPEDTDTAASIEGTLAHQHGETALILGFDADDFDDPDMADHIEGYINFIEDLTPPGAKVFAERKLPTFHTPDGNCYIDVLIVVDGGKTIRIIDLKYGKWGVEAEENKQLGIYGKTVIQRLDEAGELPNLTGRSKVEMFIYQPRDFGKPAPREWKLSKAQLEKWIKPIAATAKKILADPHNQPFSPGDDTCHFCDARDFCKARRDWVLGQFADDPDALQDRSKVAELPDPKRASTESLVRIHQLKSAILDLVEGSARELKRRIIAGEQVEDFRVVQGYGHRKWVDKGDAEEFLEDYLDPDAMFTEPQLISPSAAEKAVRSLRLGRKGRPVFDSLATLSEKPLGGPTLVAADDPRPDFDPDAQDTSAADAFENLD